MAAKTAPVALPQLLTIPQTAAVLRCSDNHVYNLIADGDLSAVDIARRGSRKPKTRVPQEVALAFLERRASKRLRVAG
jgi:excisionase family DNA binding protein